MGPSVRLGLNVGATEKEVTEEVECEALVSSLTDSAVDVFIDLVTPTECKTINKKKKERKKTPHEECDNSKVMRHKAASINKLSNRGVWVVQLLGVCLPLAQVRIPGS